MVGAQEAHVRQRRYQKDKVMAQIYKDLEEYNALAYGLMRELGTDTFFATAVRPYMTTGHEVSKMGGKQLPEGNRCLRFPLTDYHFVLYTGFMFYVFVRHEDHDEVFDMAISYEGCKKAVERRVLANLGEAFDEVLAGQNVCSVV